MTSLAEAHADDLEPWQQFLRAHAEVTRVLDRTLEAEHDLTLHGYEPLRALAATPGKRLRMSELAARVLLTASGTTRLVDALAQRGLVERLACPEDARVSYAHLTDTGAARLHAAEPTHHAAVHALFLDHFSAAERHNLHALLARLETADTAPARG